MDRKILTVIALAVTLAMGTITTIAAGTSGQPTDVRLGLVVSSILFFAYLGLVAVYIINRKPATKEATETTPVAAEPAPVAEPITETTTEVVAEDTPVAYYDFKGDIHDVIDVEGIGPKYAKKLEAIGIRTTARLCFEDADVIADRIDAPVTTVRKWQAMAQLAKVNGIGKQYAEVLVRAGVRDIDHLKRGDPERIAKQVDEYLATLKNNVLGQKVTPKRIASWQAKAKPMRRVRQPVPAA